MKENIISLAKRGKTSEARLNLLREHLHHVLLQEADRKNAFSQLCFVGGTALRLIYQLDRFSEDLDFSLLLKSASIFHFKKLVSQILKSVQGFGFDCTIERLKTEKNVQSCFFSFPGILWEVDQVFQKKQKLAIKFEVDINPPKGAKDMLSPVTGPRLYKVRHYDVSSLFSGKIHAILFRPFVKGRDLYDFLWFSGRFDGAVNGKMLANAIQQTTSQKLKLTTGVLKNFLEKRFLEIDFKKAKKDVRPFIFDETALNMFEKNFFIQLINKVFVE